jgi:histidine triad (HIT) family protein
MFNHEPAGYECPFCVLIVGGETPVSGQQDIVRRSSGAVALLSPRWWPNNHGHVLVVPEAHFENLYDLPASHGHAVHDLSREIAIAMRHTYRCDGISTRQHNEPAGDQDAWHYHVHVFPRYAGDDLYRTLPYSEWITPDRRLPYAEKLREYFLR